MPVKLLLVAVVSLVGILASHRDPAERLLRSGDLVGATEEEVVAALGEPAWQSDRAWYDLGPNAGHDGLVVYWELGDFDHGILMLHFDPENGTVSRADGRRLADDIDEIAFDEETWRAGPSPERMRMVRSLAVDVGLEGRPKAEVLEQLGPPEGAYREINYEVDSGDWLEPTLCFHLVLDARDVVTEQYTTDY